jgi:hypothetical protein
MRAHFDMMQPPELAINAGKEEFFLLRPRSQNIGFCRHWTEDTGRTGLLPMRPRIEMRADFFRLQCPQRRRQIAKNISHLCPQALLFISDHRK